MSEENMPAIEVSERNSYELAFHVLPTVAEGEVAGVFDAIKTLITTNGGELVTEEAPDRFDLAYEVIKHIDGKNRKFTSAYFGWVRFVNEPEAIEAIMEAMDANTSLLRHLLIKLSKVEEAEPFMLHEALESQKMVSTVDEAPKKEAPKAEEVKEEAKTEETVPEDK